MAKIKMQKAYIPLDIEFDDGHEIRVKIDTRERGLFRRIDKLQGFKDEYIHLAEELDDGKKSDRDFLSTLAAGELAKKMADVLKKGITLFIGEDAYNEILTGFGDGESVPAEDVNFAMVEILVEIQRLVVEYLNNHSDVITSYKNKVSHYMEGIQPSATTQSSANASGWSPAGKNSNIDQAAHAFVEAKHAQPITYTD